MVDISEPLLPSFTRADSRLDIASSLDLVLLAVQQYDIRFILRALRAICSIRKRLAKDGKGLETLQSVREIRTSTSQDPNKLSAAAKKLRPEPGSMIPEEVVYLAILKQVSHAGTLYH